MFSHFMKTLLVNGIFLSIATLSFAHVPYFEPKDFSEAQPFLVPHTIEQSIAVYAWLETDDAGYSEDIDVYVFHIDEPARIYLERYRLFDCMRHQKRLCFREVFRLKIGNVSKR